jgi:hypothetical protein
MIRFIVYMYFILSYKHFILLILLSFIILMIFVTLTKKKYKTPEDDADTLKYVGILTVYKILFMYIYIYIYCAYFGLDNKCELLLREGIWVT